MADTDPFPTIRHVLESGDTFINLIAGATIVAGQAVAFAAAGVSKTVHPAVKGTTGQPIGVALYGAASGAQVAIACTGCIVEVANADETVIDAGDILEDNDNAVGGTVSTAALVDAGVVAVVKFQIGIAIEDIAANSTGKMLVMPGLMTSANNA